MISPISFKGKVYLTGNVPNLSKPQEVAAMQEFADKNKCDVVVLDRDYYAGNAGKYQTILVQEDDECGVNFFAQKTFDFVKCGKNEEVPPFRNIPHIKLN